MASSRVAVVLAAISTGGASAQTVVSTSYTGGLVVATNNTNFEGESFTTGAGPALTDILYNEYSDAPATTPAAYGEGFLLSEEYLGTPDNLSSATPGYLGQAAAAGGYYSFGASVTLQPNTQYFFYQNGVTGQLSYGYSPGVGYETSSYPGGMYYFSGAGNVDFTSNGPGDSSNLQVQGTPVAGAPELCASSLGAPLALAVGLLLIL